MVQKRSKDLQVNLEPAIHAIVIDLSLKLGVSSSTYIRRLIIEDLMGRDLLTTEMLAQIAVGT